MTSVPCRSDCRASTWYIEYTGIELHLCISSKDRVEIEIVSNHICRSKFDILLYLLPIPCQVELNEESIRVRLGQKGCG